MDRKLRVTLGQDLSAYAEIEVDVPEGASEEVIAEAVMEKFEADPHGEDIVFSEDWGTTCSLRIVSARDADDNSVAQDVALDPIPFDGGQALENWLKGYSKGGLVAVVNAAAQAKLIDKPVIEAHRGMFTLAAETIEVEFECRKGATREERDLAFFGALNQVAKVDYVAMNETVPYAEGDTFHGRWQPCRAFKLIVEAFACDGDDDGPAFAEIDVDQTFLDKLDRMRQICVRSGLESVTVGEGPARWDSGESLRIGDDSLFVFGDTFWYRASPKNAGYDVETKGIEIGALSELAATRRDDPDRPEFAWRDGRLFYADQPALIDDLVDMAGEGTRTAAAGAYAAYLEAGQAGVEAFASEAGITERGYCPACASDVPVENGDCLVCSHTVAETSGGEA